jgi:hypothetical protein
MIVGQSLAGDLACDMPQLQPQSPICQISTQLALAWQHRSSNHHPYRPRTESPPLKNSLCSFYYRASCSPMHRERTFLQPSRTYLPAKPKKCTAQFSCVPQPSRSKSMCTEPPPFRHKDTDSFDPASTITNCPEAEQKLGRRPAVHRVGDKSVWRFSRGLIAPWGLSSCLERKRTAVVLERASVCSIRDLQGMRVLECVSRCRELQT